MKQLASPSLIMLQELRLSVHKHFITNNLSRWESKFEIVDYNDS